MTAALAALARRGDEVRDGDGYLPIADYAALGDGRAFALVGTDGSVDWLAVPSLDSPTVLGALLDPQRAGAFELRPDAPFGVARRYLPGTNVLETTFTTATGSVRVTDALTLPRGGGLAPERELARRVEGLGGRVAMRWRVEPRFGYGQGPVRLRAGRVPIASCGADAVAVLSWGAGEPRCGDDAIDGRFVACDGETALLALTSAHEQPLVLPSRDEVEERLELTAGAWRDWAGRLRHDGPWAEAVERSALALKLLIHAPSGAMAAAGTTSLPEQIGGDANWEYRYSWLRDSSFAVAALLRLGCEYETRAFLWWLMHASQLTHPHLRVLYTLNGGQEPGERTLPLRGYRDSRPVRTGNQASAQRQLGIYGNLLRTAAIYAADGRHLDDEIAERLAGVADLVCEVWRLPDAGIWEERGEPEQFTSSKIMCWAGLDCATRLGEQGELPRADPRWRREADRIRRFIEERCWDAGRRAYLRAPGSDQLDASVLLAPIVGFCSCDDERMVATVSSLRRELGRGPLLYRASDKVGKEGAFLACSFWLVEVLARRGDVEEAGALMDELIGLANDVGLFAEELEVGTDAQLGNFPQALTHLALITAAAALDEAAAP